MKKIITVIFALALLGSCGPTKKEMDEKFDKGYDWVDGTWIKRDSVETPAFLSDDIRIKTIDGHEYIVLKERGKNAGILHSESCKNQKHLN